MIPSALLNHERESPPAATECERLDSAAEPCDFAFAASLLTSRQNVSPKRLIDPGPTPGQLRALVSLAASAPDHGMLTPWRFVLVPRERRHLLAEVFALALVDRDVGATLEQLESAREKAHRAPVLLVAVARLAPSEPDIPTLERMISMGAAIQNVLLGAHAMGFGAGLTSGRAMSSPRLATLLELAEGEHAVCCINIGTVQRANRTRRTRPEPEDFFTVLGEKALVS